MAQSNIERLIQLADDVFAVRSDPNQLDINPEVMDKLRKIHPSTISGFDEGNGPVAWILLIPTTNELMQQFLAGKISEKELFELTPLNTSYEALYLCSALVLEEYRRKGIAKRLTLQAIENIRKDHPLKALFVWPFTREGELAAENLAETVNLPLYKFASPEGHK
jgi:GNAT superfamily N-acetyltransferase